MPSPGVEMAAQVLDITGRFKPDFVIAHLFGRAPSVAIKEFKGKGYPLSKVVGLVWAIFGGRHRGRRRLRVAEGYHTMQFAGVGQDFQVIKDINAMYKAQGKPPPKEQETSVYYNRGVMIAALHVEAIRNAIKAKGGAKPNSEEVKKGMEAIKDFTLGGMVPPMQMTPEDHEGGGWVQVWTVKGGKLVKDGEWFQAYRDVIKKHLAGHQLTSWPFPSAHSLQMGRGRARGGRTLSSRASCPGSSQRRAPEQTARWILVTSTGMTRVL